MTSHVVLVVGAGEVSAAFAAIGRILGWDVRVAHDEAGVITHIADTPAEIALSIAAELVAHHRGRTGAGSISERPGPIHPDLPPGTAECPAG